MNIQTIINDSWLERTKGQKLLTYHFIIASFGIAVVGIMMLCCNMGMGIDSLFFAVLGYLLMALLTASVLIAIFVKYSKVFERFILRKTYDEDWARLGYFLEMRQSVRKSFLDFVDRMADRAVLHRPSGSAELKQDQVAAMEKWRSEISELRKGFRKEFGKEDADTARAMGTLSELDDLDEKNIEFLLGSLGITRKEGDLWETGGREAYRRRASLTYLGSYLDQLERKLEWPNREISATRERLQGLKKLAKEKGVLFETGS